MFHCSNFFFFLAQWMPSPQVSNCPPGLEYLTQIDQILVQQKVELLEGKLQIGV